MRKTRCRGSLILYEISTCSSGQPQEFEDTPTLQAAREHRVIVSLLLRLFHGCSCREKFKTWVFSLTRTSISILSVFAATLAFIHPVTKLPRKLCPCVFSPVRVAVPCALGWKAAWHGLRLTRFGRHSQTGASKESLGKFHTSSLVSRCLVNLSRCMPRFLGGAHINSCFIPSN